MRHLFAVSLFPLLMAASAVAAPAPTESWGKAGITLDQYWEDSVFCGLQGYYTDISQTDDAKAFVTASKQLDSVTSGGGSTAMTVDSNAMGPDTTDIAAQAAQYAARQRNIVEGVRPDERYKSIKKVLVSNTEQCLQKRGYSKFVLTEEQRHTLRKLKYGSEERRAYLYSLASNPAVLANQKPAGQP